MDQRRTEYRNLSAMNVAKVYCGSLENERSRHHAGVQETECNPLRATSFLQTDKRSTTVASYQTSVGLGQPCCNWMDDGTKDSGQEEIGRMRRSIGAPGQFLIGGEGSQ